MKSIFIAADHAGFELKQNIIKHFSKINWVDLGTNSTSSVDYPDYADLMAEKLKDHDDFGILVCGSGQGMAIRANRYQHIRAALCWNFDSARLSREHNDANVLCLGSRLVAEEQIYVIVDAFLNTNFAGGRHQLRVEKLSKPC